MGRALRTTKGLSILFLAIQPLHPISWAAEAGISLQSFGYRKDSTPVFLGSHFNSLLRVARLISLGFADGSVWAQLAFGVSESRVLREEDVAMVLLADVLTVGRGRCGAPVYSHYLEGEGAGLTFHVVVC